MCARVVAFRYLPSYKIIHALKCNCIVDTIHIAIGRKRTAVQLRTPYTQHLHAHASRGGPLRSSDTPRDTRPDTAHAHLSPHSSHAHADQYYARVCGLCPDTVASVVCGVAHTGVTAQSPVTCSAHGGAHLRSRGRALASTKLVVCRASDSRAATCTGTTPSAYEKNKLQGAKA